MNTSDNINILKIKIADRIKYYCENMDTLRYVSVCSFFDNIKHKYQPLYPETTQTHSIMIFIDTCITKLKIFDIFNADINYSLDKPTKTKRFIDEIINNAESCFIYIHHITFLNELFYFFDQCLPIEKQHNYFNWQNNCSIA